MEEKTFEEALNELDSILKKLESGETPLEKAIDEYTNAMKLVKLCNDKLNSATDRVNKILAENGELKDFDVESNQ